MLFILGVENPKEIYLCTEDQFESYTNVTNQAITEVAEKSEVVTNVAVGDFVLVHSDEFFYRAYISEVVDATKVKVNQIDLAIKDKEFLMTDIRKADPSLSKFPILASKCCIESWITKSDKEVQEAGQTLQDMMEIYEKVQVEVKETTEDFIKVSIPSIEERLNKSPQKQKMSRADLLKAKLKK